MRKFDIDTISQTAQCSTNHDLLGFWVAEGSSVMTRGGPAAFQIWMVPSAQTIRSWVEPEPRRDVSLCQ